MTAAEPEAEPEKALNEIQITVCWPDWYEGIDTQEVVDAVESHVEAMRDEVMGRWSSFSVFVRSPGPSTKMRLQIELQEAEEAFVADDGRDPELVERIDRLRAEIADLPS